MDEAAETTPQAPAHEEPIPAPPVEPTPAVVVPVEAPPPEPVTAPIAEPASPPPSAPPADFSMTPEQFCIHLSHSDKRVELIGGFHSEIRGKPRASEAEWIKAFEAFINRPL